MMNIRGNIIFKRTICITLSFLMIISSCSFTGLLAESFAEDEEVIEIYTVEDLYAINNNMSGNYKLMNDIDLSEATAEGGDYDFMGNGWEPIGSGGIYGNTAFTGTLDGNGFTVSGIRIDVNNIPSGVDKLYIGLFACNNGLIKNLYIEGDYKTGAITTGDSYMGSITGVNLGTIDNCHSAVKLYNYQRVTESKTTIVISTGGIAGGNEGTISMSSNKAEIESRGNWVDKYYYGNHYYYVEQHLGGISGYNKGTVQTSYNLGDIQAIESSPNSTGGATIGAGGIAGSSYYLTRDQMGTIINCYNSGNVASNLDRGIGCGISPYDNVSFCINIGNVGGEAIGSNGTNNYYISGAGSTSGGAKELSSAQMAIKGNYGTFDFDNTWVIDSDSDYPYPQLQNNRQDNLDIEKVVLKSKPTKTEYLTGDEINPSGGQFKVYYKDSSTEIIDITSTMLSGYDMSTAGKQTITASYRGFPVTYEINVTQRPDLDSLVLLSEPTTKTFVKGTSFDFSGCKVKAIYVGGTFETIEVDESMTKGGNINTVGEQTITFNYYGKSVSFDVEVLPIEATSIVIDQKPTKTQWVEGQDINYDGLVVKANLNDGTQKTIEQGKYDITEIPTSVGKHTIKVTYEGFEASFEISIAENVLLSIDVTTSPSITEYVLGQELDTDGMVIMGTYSNGKLKEVEDYTVSALPTTIGFGYATISYQGKTTTVQVKMIAKELAGIKVATLPTKTSYISGEDIDTAGIKVVKVYNDGDEVEITDYTVVEKVAPLAGNKTITINWDGFTTTYPITVVDKAVTQLSVKMPTKTSYIDDEEFDPTGMVVTAYYDNGKHESVTGYDVTGFGDTWETNAVTISYGGKAYVIYVTRHTSGEWKVTKPQNCTEKGEKTLYCAECGVAIKTEEIAADGHSYGDWEEIVSPKCVDKGSKQRVCSVCGYIDTAEVEAKGHDWESDYTIDKKASCTEDGSKSIHCKNCEVVKDSTVIKATGHDEKTVTTKATVDEDGLIKTTCNTCKEVLEETVIHKIKSIELIEDEYVYDGNEKKAELLILDRVNKRLTEGTDYTVEYRNNTNVGTAKAIVKFTGNYQGTIVKEFTITPAEPEYVVPTGLTAVYGETLADIELPTGFSWMDASQSVGNVGTNKFKVKFVPTEKDNYSVVENIEVYVKVTKATPSYELPTGLKATYGDTLSDVKLPKGFTWTDADTSVGTVGTHDFTVQFTPEDTDNYIVVKNIPVSVEVEKADPIYTVPTGLTAVYGSQLKDIELENGYTWKYEDLYVGNAGTREFTVVYTPEDENNYNVVEFKVSVEITKADSTYTKPTGLKATYGDTLSDVKLPKGFTWTDGDQSVGTAGSHDYTVKYTPEDTDNYKTVKEIYVTVEVSKADPTYSVPTGLTAVYGKTLNDVTLPTGFAWIDKTASVGTVGTHKYEAIYTPTDTTNYNTKEVQIEVKVTKATPSYELPTGLKATYGDTLSDVKLPKGFTWTDADQSVGVAGTHTFKATYTPADTDNYNVVENIEVTVEVSKADPTYSIPADLTAVYGKTLNDVTLPTGFAWTDKTASVGTVGTHKYDAIYTPTDTTNYNTKTVQIEVKVTKATPSYELPTSLKATYGDTLSDVKLPKGFTWTDADQSVGVAGTHTFKATYTPADTDNYSVVENIEVTVEVSKADPTYSIPTDLTAVYSKTLNDVTLPTGFAWSDNTASVGTVGTHKYEAIYTPTDTTNYNTKTVQIEVKVTKATPSYELPTGLKATYGDTLSDVKLPKGFTWTDADQSVGNLGSNTFTATYTPEDTDNYKVIKGIAVQVAVSKVKAISGEGFTVSLESNTCSYTGLPQEPKATVTNNKGVELTEDTDYTVAYSNNTNVGTAKATVVLQGNYEGTIETSFEITAATKSSVNATIASNYVTYTGAEIKPAVTVKGVGGAYLTEGQDYSLQYEDNTAVGNASVKIELKGNYTGEIVKYFNITQAEGKNLDIQLSDNEYVYDGKAKTPAPIITGLDGRTLTKGSDYTVEYLNNTNAGTAYVVISFKGNYHGEVTKSFTIMKLTLDAELLQTSFVYSGQSVEPEVKLLASEGLNLQQGTDYELKYTDNTNVGTGSVKVVLKGNYSGEITKEFEITQADGTKLTCELSDAEYVYDGKSKTPTPIITGLDGKSLTKGADYTVEYSNNKNAGTAKATITFKGNYSGTTTENFEIKALKVDAELLKTSYNYKGTAIEPEFTLLASSGLEPEEGTDYTVEYSDNNAPGTGHVTLTFSGNYTGKVKKDFVINRTYMLSGNVLTASASKDYKVSLFDASGNEQKASMNSNAYDMKYVDAGEYTAKVSASGDYVSRDYSLNVADDITQNFELFMLGDANCDNFRDATDITRIARHLARLSVEKDDYTLKLFNVDRSEDGKITAADATKLARFAAGIITSL